MGEARAATPDDVVKEKFRRYRATRDRRLRNELVEEHRWLARVAARRFNQRGEPMDDLLQVALLGVLKAVERFDPDYGASFASFALPTVTGELRRHFRDATWALRVTRRVKELHLELSSMVETLTHERGRPPTVDELAGALGVSVDELLEAMEAGNAYRTSPLSGRLGDDGSSEEAPATAYDDRSLISADERLALHDLMRQLPQRERRVLYLRFFCDLTQTEIAERVGVSQVHVSRLLRTCLRDMRRGLETDDGGGTALTVDAHQARNAVGGGRHRRR